MLRAVVLTQYRRVTDGIAVASTALAMRRAVKINKSYSVEIRMWADAQRDGRPAKYRWRPLLNAAKSG